MTSSAPLVCICIPTFNAGKTIAETLRSILSQSYRNLVVHVVDNASEDDTVLLVEAFSDSRLHVHVHTVNVGGEGNFTRCMKMGEGRYCAIFHADDVYSEFMIEKQVKCLERLPHVEAVLTAARTIDEHGTTIGLIGRVPERESEELVVLNAKDLMSATLLHHNFLVASSMMVRTTLYRDVLPSWGETSFRSASDVGMFIQISLRHPLAVLSEPLMSYRISTGQYSERIRNRTERADFYLVMDHYTQAPETVPLLSSRDLRHYGWLKRHEQVTLALNLHGMQRYNESRALLHGVVSSDAFVAAANTRRGLVTLCAAILLKCLHALGIARFTHGLARSVKRLGWRAARRAR